MNSEITVRSGSLVRFECGENCPVGIIKIADKVREDISRVLGGMPAAVNARPAARPELTVVFGTADCISEEIEPRISAVRGRREVFGFFVLPEKKTLVIAGSDKRGTIYGLFHLSELLGVSPMVNWSDIRPARKESFTLSAGDRMVSKEPSVRYRGFFINDEWPAFGTWAVKHFGGVNAKLYEGVFELLLRLKGNYLWPAMWASCFACDGPGLQSAELADELGVIMGLSHHEPCLRHGEEFSKLRGKDSPYGDAWSFITNREGITNFWRDGLRRNGHLENVITVGMRGERDSTILGEDATLRDNIDLLRGVLKTQNRLIREEVNSDLEKVPRMLALYKEVEPYYYGDETTEGLAGDPELDGVILMLCDDNHGYVRSLPDEKMRSHKGGFGMYYHFDYHGAPVSYEWINSTHLPEVWEQMSTCYEHGVSELWIVNVGDLGLQEFPLSYFLDLAYDFEKWGTDNAESPREYTEQWCERQFGSALSREDIRGLAELILRGERLIHNRRPEHLNEQAFDLKNTDVLALLDECGEISRRCAEYEEKLPEELRAGFFETVGYSLTAGMNLIELWLCRALNRYFAELGAVCANGYAERMKACLARDDSLRERLHTEAGGKWDGFGLAEHIGFKNWNSEECRYPIIETVIPVRRAELAAGICFAEGATRGQPWTGKVLKAGRLKSSGGRRYIRLFAALTGDRNVPFTVTCGSGLLTPDITSGELTPEAPLSIITLTAAGNASGTAAVTVAYAGGTVKAEITVSALGEEMTEEDGVIEFRAEQYSLSAAAEGCELRAVKNLGREEYGLRLFPLTAEPESLDSAPYAEYHFDAEREGEFDLTFTLMPCNPYTFGERVRLAYSLNGESRELPVTAEDYEAGVTADWEQGVIEHARYVSESVRLKAGRNVLRFYGVSREAVLEAVRLERR